MINGDREDLVFSIHGPYVAKDWNDELRSQNSFPAVPLESSEEVNRFVYSCETSPSAALYEVVVILLAWLEEGYK